MARCKLCQEDTKLIKKSHIFPDFLYRDFYDDQHRLRKFNLAEMTKINPRFSKPPTGIYEGGLLCHKCDGSRIGALETYVSLLLKGNKPLKIKVIKNVHGINIFKVNGIDSKVLKLFLLSILYRASISSHSEFKDVNLGPYEEKLRTALLNENLGNIRIQVSILKFARNSNFTRFIAQPIRSKIGHTTVYSVVINGYMIIYFLSESDMSKRMHNFRIRAENVLEIMQVPKEQVEKFIVSLILQHQ